MGAKRLGVEPNTMKKQLTAIVFSALMPTLTANAYETDTHAFIVVQAWQRSQLGQETAVPSELWTRLGFDRRVYTSVFGPGPSYRNFGEDNMYLDASASETPSFERPTP